MADREAHQKGYSYHEMSNKVEQADRSVLRGRGSEPTGEVESLRGREQIGRMGDRIESGKTRPAEVEAKLEKAQKKRQKREQTSTRRGGDSILAASGGQTILDLGSLTGYQPSTPSSQAAFETLLVRILSTRFYGIFLSVSPPHKIFFLNSRLPQNTIGSRAMLGNQSTSVLRDAAEEVIVTLKDQNMKDPDRHDAISRLLTGKSAKSGNGVSSEQYATLVQLGKALDDYNEFAQAQKPRDSDTADKLDDEMGVAVVFDSDEDNEGEGGSDEDDDQVVDASDASSEEEEDDGEDVPKDVVDADDDEEVIVQGGPEVSKKKLHHAHGRTLSVHEIDAQYLQRQLSRHFDDAEVCAKISNDVLSVLDVRNGSDIRECENKLLVLLGFDLFDTIKLLLHNRVRIWACVSMKRAQNEEERSEIESILDGESTGEGKRVWEELHSKSMAQDWTRERMRGITDSLQNKNDVGEKSVSQALDSIGVKGSVGDGKINGETGENMEVDKDDEPIELDLDSLAFRDGSHTMSNKKCNLPEKSWRAMKKGYEEVHVPAVRSVIPSDEKLVPIAELPSWTHPAFKGKSHLTELNASIRQVVVYPLHLFGAQCCFLIANF